jgi:hypothetical protein
MKFKVQSAPSQTKLFGGLIIAASLMFSQSVWALGTASGTTINNLAKLSYSVGGTAQNEICSSATGNSTGNGGTTGTTCTAGTNGAGNTAFVVDNKVNLTLVTNDAAAVSVVPGQANVVTTYTLTNTGNTVQDYSFTAANLSSIAANNVFPLAGPVNDTFDTGACSVFVETNGTAGYQVADNLLFVDELAADASKVVYVVCASILGTQVNNDQANVSLTATTLVGGAAGQGIAAVNAVTNTAGVDVVFADVQVVASGAVAPLQVNVNANNTNPIQAGVDGKAVANDAYKVVSANLSVAKTVTLLCDPVNGNTNPKNIPGALVQYAITISNTGSAAASLTSLSDVLQLTNGPAGVVGAGATATGPQGLAFDTRLNAGTGGAAGCTPAGGTALSGTTGFAAKTGLNPGPGVVAPGVAADATTAGATIAVQTVTVNFTTLATSAITAPAAATLAAGSYITVYFNAFVQ